MAYLSVSNLIGNVGENPEFKAFDSGKQVANFSLAYNEKGYTTEGGKTIPDHTEWYDIVVWGKRAEFVRDYIKKGDSVFVQGKFKSRTYTDANNIDRKVFELIADDVQLCRKASPKEEEPEK